MSATGTPAGERLVDIIGGVGAEMRGGCGGVGGVIIDVFQNET